MSSAIHRSMRRRFSSAAAAASPSTLPGASLYALQQWAGRHDYDTFFIGSLGWRRDERRSRVRRRGEARNAAGVASGRRPAVVIPISGALWRDEYEVRCHAMTRATTSAARGDTRP